MLLRSGDSLIDLLLDAGRYDDIVADAGDLNKMLDLRLQVFGWTEQEPDRFSEMTRTRPRTTAL